MATLVEIAGGLVAAHAAKNLLTTDQLLQELGKVHTALKGLQSAHKGGRAVKPGLTLRQAFKKDEVVCMICRRRGFQTLGRHLRHAHQVEPRDYRKQFGIPAEQSLCSRFFSDTRRQMALDLGLADILAEAREVRLAKIRLKKQTVAKPAQPKTLRKVKAPVIAVANP